MKFLKNKDPKKVLIIGSLLFLIVAEVLFLFLTRKIEGADVNLVRREIETPDKLIFNGYLSHFFRFRHFGIINLLVLPFLIYDLYRYRLLKQWQKAFLFIYVFSLILIGMKGFFNPRYAMTMFPISICYLVYSLHLMFKRNGLHEIAKSAPFYLAGIGLFFFIQQGLFDKLTNTFPEKYILKQDYDGRSNGPNLKYKGCNTDFFGVRIMKAILFDNYPNYRTNERFDQNCLTFSQREIFDFIQKNADNGGKKFLTNNLPAIYYFTDVNAVYYWAGDDLIYDNKGRRPLFGIRDQEDISSYLMDSLNVGYIYTYEPYNRYNEDFYNFLKEECELIIQNYSTYQIFKIKDQ